MRYLWIILLLVVACAQQPAKTSEQTVPELPIVGNEQPSEPLGELRNGMVRYAQETKIEDIQADCSSRGGTFNECGSACDEGEVCIAMCVPVCILEQKAAPKVEGSLTVKSATHDVKIKDFAFMPPLVQINKGDTVRWTNLDEVRHTATGDDFDSGLLAKGQTWEYTFTDVGSFDYLCTPHPRMKGQVVVN